MDHVVVIGAYGSAGVAVAERLVEEPDVELTLIDDGDPGGGLCILRGCMPSKDVLSAGAHMHQAHADERLEAEISPDIDAIVDRKNDHVQSFASHRRAAVDGMGGRDDVTFLHDTAEFVDDRVVAVGGREIEADYVFIATGSTVNVPPLPGIEDVEYQTSADVLDARSFPDSGVVMGFGAVGLELVPYLATVGDVDLTVIEHDAQPLDAVDPAIGDWILDHYREAYGVDIRTHAYEQELERTSSGDVRLTIEEDGQERTIDAEELYLFTGRRPSLDGLGLERTSLPQDGQLIMPTLQSVADERVYVVGDANGWEPILHVAKEQGYHAADNLLAQREGNTPQPFTFTKHQVIFSGLGNYPYARLGLTEDEAREEGYDPIVAERYASDDGVFKVKDVPGGLARLVVAGDGTVLGYVGVHYQADTMAKTMQVLIEAGMDVRDVPDRAFHPTTPEIIDGLVREAAGSLE